ncbi:MAG: hypothetical protein ABIH74_03240 [Candidatus Omnitrophota bacterium]
MKKKIIKKTKFQKTILPLGIATAKGKIALLSKGNKRGEITLRFAAGRTNASFSRRKDKLAIVSKTKQKVNIENLDNINIVPYDEGYFMTFVRKDGASRILEGAVSRDLKRFTVTGKIAAGQKNSLFAPNYKNNGKYLIYLSENSITTAASKDLKKWKASNILSLRPRSSFFDHAPLTVLGVSLTPHGLLVIYDASYRHVGNTQLLQVGGALFSLSDPDELIWRSEAPLWEEVLPTGSSVLYPVGAAYQDEEVYLYYASKKGEVFTVHFPQPFPSVKGKKAFARLKRFYKNPIIVPDPANEWESEATFNPAALYDDGKVHLLYRAVRRGGISCFGHASSKDGFHFEKSSPEPAYIPRKDFEGVHTKPTQITDLYKSGCGWGGCEDPKLTAMDGRIYLTYVAYNGYSHPRIALSSIDRADFLRKKWNWKEPILISPPGVIDKSGCILPEKVKGKYVIFHRIFPHILIDYRDDLRFNNGRWLEAKHKITTRPGMWDSRKLSVGATPIKTDAGWLVIYHAIDDRDDSRYKIGAMILALEDPSKVLYRTSKPILEPEEHYENEGKPGIVYPCGAVVLKDELFVYYGGGDRVACCATAQLEQFVKAVKKDKRISYQLKKVVY